MKVSLKSIPARWEKRVHTNLAFRLFLASSSILWVLYTYFDFKAFSPVSKFASTHVLFIINESVSPLMAVFYSAAACFTPLGSPETICIVQNFFDCSFLLGMRLEERIFASTGTFFALYIFEDDSLSLSVPTDGGSHSSESSRWLLSDSSSAYKEFTFDSIDSILGTNSISLQVRSQLTAILSNKNHYRHITSLFRLPKKHHITTYVGTVAKRNFFRRLLSCCRLSCAC